MPGFRVGYAAGPEKLISAMTKLHIFSSISAPTMSQVAGVAALNGPQAAVTKMIKEYDRRRRMVCKRLQQIPNFFLLEPKGAFYAFPNVKEFGMDSLTFAETILNKAKVAVVPGTEFGSLGEGYIRLSYATACEKIEQGLDRIERFVSKL